MSFALAGGSFTSWWWERPLSFIETKENQGGEVDSAVQPGATREMENKEASQEAREQTLATGQSPDTLGSEGDALSWAAPSAQACRRVGWAGKPLRVPRVPESATGQSSWGPGTLCQPQGKPTCR